MFKVLTVSKAMLTSAPRCRARLGQWAIYRTQVASWTRAVSQGNETNFPAALAETLNYRLSLTASVVSFITDLDFLLPVLQVALNHS